MQQPGVEEEKTARAPNHDATGSASFISDENAVREKIHKKIQIVYNELKKVLATRATPSKESHRRMATSWLKRLVDAFGPPSHALWFSNKRQTLIELFNKAHWKAESPNKRFGEPIEGSEPPTVDALLELAGDLIDNLVTIRD